MDYAVRALTVDDEPVVWEMLQYASHEPSLDSVQKQPYLARYASSWGRVGDVGCVAIRDTASIGAAWLRLWLEEDKGFGYVNDVIPELAMAVLPDYRGQGVGTRLLVQVLDMAKEWFPAVSLNVRADNPVVRLYERLGFITVPGSEIVNRTGGISFNMLCEFE
ncbi:GNAT family acetyltransferase [Neosynechococcus sphagnicola sy1]|uniref:GNAT family acetyltransferase n=1 Tax=Neosynechococcus sphagnicola sy1 TaxID=1497020 RepID=A0A098TGW8_9CYAN|nr:GNAT family N-acetyltransferase [Neosynechococcus sphagnicola]KGF71339.1 GNAT family acetyltransferase [Neosynechococcus sphagnicola sy1]